MNQLLVAIIAFSSIAYNASLEAGESSRMIYGEAARIENIDPYTIHDASAYRLSDLIFDDLISVGPNGTYQPSLAESWQVEKSGSAVLVKLKDGVFWHSSKNEAQKELTTSDITTTIRILKSDNSDIPNSERFRILAKAERISSKLVRIHYTRALADPLKPLLFKVLPDHLLHNSSGLSRNNPFTKNPFGTGPYKIGEINKQGEILLVANDSYFKGAPKIKQIIMKPFADQTIMAQSLLFRSLDLVTYLSPKDLKEVEGDRKMQLVPYEAQSFSFIALNTETEALKDRRVRQAISYAINRAEMLEAFFQGKGQLISGPFAPTSWAYNLDVKGYEFDTKRASSLLQQSGYYTSDSNNTKSNESLKKIKLNFAVPIAGESEMIKRLALAVQSYLVKVGIETNLNFYEWEIWKRKVLGEQDYDITIASWDFDDSANITSLFHSSSSRPWGNNFVKYSNASVDSMLLEAEATNDFDKKRAIFKKLHSVIANDSPYVFLWTLKHHAAHNQRLTGVRVEPFSFFKHISMWNVRDI